MGLGQRESRGQGAVTTVVERIRDTFLFRNTMPNKGRRIKIERSNPSHLFHRCLLPHSALRHLALLPIVLLSLSQ